MTKKIYKLLMLTSLLLFTNLTQGSVVVTTFPNIFLGITQITQTGNLLDVSIGISGLTSGAAPSLGTYDIDINFDPTYLSYNSTLLGDQVLGNQLDLTNLFSNLSSGEVTSPGVLNLYELSFDSVADLNALQADSFTLATVAFDVLKAGTTQLSLISNVLGDADGNALSAIIGPSVPITIETLPSSVPLPSSLFMMAPGLAGLVFAGRRRKSVC